MIQIAACLSSLKLLNFKEGKVLSADKINTFFTAALTRRTKQNSYLVTRCLAHAREVDQENLFALNSVVV